MILRPYQQDAIDAFFAHVKLKGNIGRHYLSPSDRFGQERHTCGYLQNPPDPLGRYENHRVHTPV